MGQNCLTPFQHIQSISITQTDCQQTSHTLTLSAARTGSRQKILKVESLKTRKMDSTLALMAVAALYFFLIREIIYGVTVWSQMKMGKRGYGQHQKRLIRRLSALSSKMAKLRKVIFSQVQPQRLKTTAEINGNFVILDRTK